MIKTLLLLTITFVSSLSSLYGCEKIYLSFDKESRVELQSAQKVAEIKAHQNIEFIHRPFFKGIDESDLNYEAGSRILNLIDDTDFTGADVYVEVYRVNVHGQVILMGSSMEGAMFRKVNKMVDLALRGLDFTCGKRNSL